MEMIKDLAYILSADLGYVIVAFLAIYFSGWLIYDRVATRGYNLAHALFEERNFAAGLEIAAFLMVEILIALNAMSGDEVTKMNEAGEMVINYWTDLEAVALTIIFSNVTFFAFRYLASVFIKKHFKGQLDSHGETVSYNNEIFGQHNLGAALFSVSYLIIMYFMIFQEDFLGTQQYQVGSAVNMLVVFITGALVYLIHNIAFMAKGHTTLHELFIDNNSGVGMSVAGFMFAILYLESRLMIRFVHDEHFFKTDLTTYVYLVLVFCFILLFRRFFILCMDVFTRRKFASDFLVEDNPVAGLLDMTFVASTGLILGTIL